MIKTTFKSLADIYRYALIFRALARCYIFLNALTVDEHAHWSWYTPGALRYVAIMIVTGIIGWTILMIAEYRLLQKVNKYKWMFV